MRTTFALSVLSLLMFGCGPSPEEREAEAETMRQQAQADSVMLAEEMYDPAAFDTISWETEEAELERGGVVFSYSCRKCHGEGGAGDGGFVQRGDTLRPPSFLAEEWELDREMIRQRVFAGTAEGMPHWGFYGLNYRDIDAVATYILEELREQ